jgi:hypothetical protein
VKRIFVIGLNRCGTVSFHRFFLRNRIKSAHYAANLENKKINLAKLLINNLTIGHEPVRGLEEIIAFSDMSYADNTVYIDGSRLYKSIYEYYSDSYYILNVRDVENWLRSRFNHKNGSLAVRSCSIYGCSSEELREIWRAQFVKHEEDVLNFFSHNGGNLLYFDIEKDDPKAIRTFLQKDYDVDTRHWRHEHRTKYS